MNIDDTKKSRAALKSYFVKNAIPTEQQFAQLMDSILNQRDDGLVKVSGDPLLIEAAGDDSSFKKALNFYNHLSDADPAWTVSLRPRANPADPNTGRPGWSISDASGNSRLSIDAANGRVGIGTVQPDEALHVAGRVKISELMIASLGNNYSYIGASASSASLDSAYSLAVGTSGAALGDTIINGTRIDFRTGNTSRMTVTASGHLGVGVGAPAEMLEVNGRANVGQAMMGPWPANPGQYVFFGASTLDQSQAGNYALLQGTGSDVGTTYVNSPKSLHLRIGNADRALIDAAGNFTVFGPIYGSNSDIYFTKTDHNHSGIGNTAGYAAIENAANYGALMLLGRSGGPQGRVVKLWDYLQVNGNLEVTGNIGTHGQPAAPRTPGWGGGVHTLDVEAEGTIWSRNGVQSGNRDLAENFFSHDHLTSGDVVSLDPDLDLIVRTTEPNCHRVIGVISTEPGFVLNTLVNRDAPGDGSVGFPVALSGRVPCKVTDEGGPIRRGDLLTSASKPGYAMRSTLINADGVHRPGTIIGKALSGHRAGDGAIEIFVMLK